MNNKKTKRIAFRLSEEEYESLMNDKPTYETISQYLRRRLFYSEEV